MKSAKKLMALLLAVVMVCSMLPLTAMADFAKVNSWETEVYTDVSSGDWFYENVKTAYELGLMIGHDDSTFAPEGHLTMAQTIAIAARLHSIAATGSESFEQGSPWYKVYADYALAQGIISSEPDNWAREATRIEFARIMVKALPAEDLAPINDVAYGDIPDVADDEAVYTLYRAGILRGNDDTLRFEPESSIRRSEVAAIVTRMADPSLRIHAEPEQPEQPEETPSQPEQPSQPGGGIVIKPVTKPEGETASGDVTADENGKSAEEVTLTGETVKATVPAGVALEDGADSLTLTVSPVKESESNIQLGKDESMASYDVHIDGVAEDNTVAIIVELGAVLPMGLNWGNISLYHVENGETVPMTRVETLSELDEHNEFFYDPATGCVTVALACFSEITSLYNTENKWNGNRDYTWYDASKTTLTIANADQLAGLSAIVGGMDGRTQDSFSGKTVKLIANIYIGDTDSENGIVFYPIGYYNSDGTYAKTNTAITSGFKPFEGTFDGNGHTIASFYQNTWEMKGDHNWYDAELQYYRDGMGLFGKVYGGTVKNLTVENFSSDGEIATTGVIAAYADCGALFENISIFNCNPRVYNIGNGGIVGCVGWYANDAHTTPVTFRNITVDNTNKISALWGSWDVPCGGLVGQYYPTSGQENAIDNAGIYMENCHVAAQIDVNNDVCANYQYYAYRYAGILIGSVRENVEQDGHIYPKMDGITAKNCTVHFGDWNDYYYCELVANSLASYTHDHQFSRLTQVLSVDVANMKVTSLDGVTTDIPTSGAANYVVVKAKDANGMWIHGDGAEYATCYHFVDGKVWNHADGGYEEKDIDGDGVVDSDVLKEDKQLVYREFNNLVTGYGWGVTSKGIGEMAGVTILDNDSSSKKFDVNAAQSAYVTGTTVTIGQLFKAAANAGVAINAANVQVFVSPADDTSTANAVYTPNTTDWTAGTLTFSGLGAATITISDYYYCIPTTIEIEVLPVEVTMIAVANFKENFIKGEAFSTGSSFIAIAAYSDGSTRDVTGEVTFSGYNSNEVGVQFITVSYTFAGKTATTTYEVRVNAAVKIVIEPNQNAFDLNTHLTKDHFTVRVMDNLGHSTVTTNFDIGSVDMSSAGTKTVSVTDINNNLTGTCTIEVINLTVLEIDYSAKQNYYTTWTENYHRMWWFGSGNYDVSGWKPYPEFGTTIPEGKTDTGANGETVTGFENDWAAIQNSHADYADSGVGHENDFKNNNNWYGLTVDNAVPNTTLGINCVVGYDAPILGFGYYIDGDVTTLKYSPPAASYTNADFVWNYGKYNGHALTQFSCYDFEPGKSYSVTWVAVFEDGIQKISDWTVNMKPIDDSSKVFIDTEKPNVNVIIMAGQSNMFGAAPITQAVRNNFGNVDYSNVFLHYNNINFNADGNLQTYFSNDGFDMYQLGIGGQGNTYFGPETALAKILATTPGLMEDQWYIIKYAAAGTILNTQWLGSCTVNGQATTLTNDMLSYVQSAIDSLSADYDVQVRSFMWMQGESDAITTAWANSYAAAEKNLVSRVREAFAGYATRISSAPGVPGSGISFINAGIAINDTDLTYAQGGPNDWVYAEIVNAGKISNSQWLCSTNASQSTPNPPAGPLAGYSFHVNGTYIPSIVNPDQSNAIVNSIYMDTYHLISKFNASVEHPEYVEGDRTDWAHYCAASMINLGELFSSGLHFLIVQNG